MPKISKSFLLLSLVPHIFNPSVYHITHAFKMHPVPDHISPGHCKHLLFTWTIMTPTSLTLRLLRPLCWLHHPSPSACSLFPSPLWLPWGSCHGLHSILFTYVFCLLPGFSIWISAPGDQGFLGWFIVFLGSITEPVHRIYSDLHGIKGWLREGRNMKQGVKFKGHANSHISHEAWTKCVGDWRLHFTGGRVLAR
jgi:hypothetical protein